RERDSGKCRSVHLRLGMAGCMLASFQRAMPSVDADVTCFLDADDYWEPEYLQRIGQVYDSQPEIDAVFSDLQNFGHDDEKLSFHSREIDLGFTAMIDRKSTRLNSSHVSISYAVFCL